MKRGIAMDNEVNGKLAYSIEEAAAALGISRCLAYELVRQGKIPSIRLGERRLIVPVAALNRMLGGQEQEQAKDEAEKVQK